MQDTLWKSCWKTSLLVLLTLGVCALAPAQAAEDRLLEVLASPTASVADKCNACRELQTAGSERAVAALAACLSDPAVAHAARMALEVMPYPAAGAALREAVGRASGLARSGIIDSLGERRDAEAVPILAAALTDPDATVRAAAAAALRKIGTAEAAGALAAAHSKAEGEDRIARGLALTRCADRLLDAGQREAAAQHYAILAQATEAAVVRQAALRGVFQAAGPEAASAVVQGLGDNDRFVRQAAAGQLRNLSDKAFRQVAQSTSDLPLDGQVAVLAAIAARRDKSLAASVLRACDSSDPAVRLAAIRALGRIGDATVLPQLLNSAGQDNPVGQAAWQGLLNLNDPRVDEEIARLIRAEQDPQRRATWIGLVEARRPAGGAALLLQEAAHERSEVRSRAMAALANLAGPQDLAPMTAAVLRAEKGAERDSAEKAVMLVCQQLPDAEKRAEPVLEVLRKSRPADRAELLPLVGRIGGSEARREIQAALNSNDPVLVEAGARAISNWPDASVAGQLLELSQQAALPAHRLWALRAFIRVIALPSDIPDAQKLAMLQQALGRAERDEERQLVLQRVSAVRTVEALRFLLPYLDQPPLAQTAGASIAELGRHKELRDPNKAEFIPALEKVLQTHRDGTIQEQVRRYLQAAREG